MMQTMMMQFIGIMFGFDWDGFLSVRAAPDPAARNPAPGVSVLCSGSAGSGLGTLGGGRIRYLLSTLRCGPIPGCVFSVIDDVSLFSLLGKTVCGLYTVRSAFPLDRSKVLDRRPIPAVLVQVARMIISSPCVKGIPTVLPSGIELTLQQNKRYTQEGSTGFAWFFSRYFLPLALACYRRILTWQGTVIGRPESAQNT